MAEIKGFKGFRKFLKSLQPSFDINLLARTPFTQIEQQARGRVSPLLQRLASREAFLRPRTAEAAFAPEAARGFGLSDIAKDTVQAALAELGTRFETRRGGAITGAIQNLLREEQSRRDEAFREQAFRAEQNIRRQELELQRKASKRKKFLGIF